MHPFAKGWRVGSGIWLLLLFLTGCASPGRRSEQPGYPPDWTAADVLLNVPFLAAEPDNPYPAMLSMLNAYWTDDTGRRWLRRAAVDWGRDVTGADADWEAALREVGLWAYWGEGRLATLAERLDQAIPVWLFVQSSPWSRRDLRPVLVIGRDLAGKRWWMYEPTGPAIWSTAQLERQWSNAGWRWVVIVPPQAAEWDLTPAQHRSRGRYWMALHDYERAADDFEAALVAASDEAIYYVELADSHLHRGQYTLAEPLYRAALTLDDLQARAMNNLAYTLTQQGLAAQLAAREDVTNADDRLATAQVLLDEAVEWARRATVLQPDNPRLLNTLGQALHYQGKHRQAVPVLQRARARAMQDDALTQAQIALNLVEVYHTLGQRHLARQTLADALQHNPALHVPRHLHVHLRQEYRVPRR